MRFLPQNPPYRRSRTKKNEKVFDSSPPQLSGNDLLKKFIDFVAERTSYLGGNIYY